MIPNRMLTITRTLVITAVALALGGCPPSQVQWQQACDFLVHVDAEAGDFAHVATPDVAEFIHSAREDAAPVLAMVCAIAADPNAEDPTAALTVLLDGALTWAIESERQDIAMYIYGVRATLRLSGVKIPAYTPPVGARNIVRVREPEDDHLLAHEFAAATNIDPPRPSLGK
jgi:hypothetical protein